MCLGPSVLITLSQNGVYGGYVFIGYLAMLEVSRLYKIFLDYYVMAQTFSTNVRF
jgi:hypothetical protein